MTARDKVFEHDGKRISYREAEMLMCCARGLTVNETADFLCLSKATIKRHREHVREHFDLKGYHTLDCFAMKLLPELEKWATWPIDLQI